MNADTPTPPGTSGNAPGNASASTPVIRLELDALHESLGARMVSFAGYRMPVQYAGLKSEHLHTREHAGLFDVSHMGQLRITANDGGQCNLYAALESAFPIDFDNWPLDLQRYTVLMNAQGGIEDDLMLVRRADEVRAVVNAGNRETDLSLLQSLCPNLTFEWVNAALVALQGPAAEQVLSALDPAAAKLRFMQTAELNLDGATCLTSRSGYTGEDGYEISIPSADAERIVQRLLANALVQPIGLGARDSLRLEAGLPLHGNDISGQTTPVQAGLKFAIASSRRAGGAKTGGFPGASTILDQLAGEFASQFSIESGQDCTADVRLVGLRSSDNVPIRQGAEIVDEQQRTVGTVTSGTISPTLNQPIMLAYLDSTALAKAGATKLQAVVRNKRPDVSVTPLPFVPKQYKR
ncbi:MAG: glycine cleavage system aminomethyltransferase GcvT [Burkholderiaceae bacterium]